MTGKEADMFTGYTHAQNTPTDIDLSLSTNYQHALTVTFALTSGAVSEVTCTRYDGLYPGVCNVTCI